MSNELTPKNSSNLIKDENRPGEFKVVLPCEVSEFGEFISGLLGKSQIMEGSIAGAIDVTAQDIKNIYELIQQRVTAQNKGGRVNLEITVFYSDGNSVTHNNWGDFDNFYPIDEAYPIEVLLSVSYLIEFNHTPSAQKQSIEVSLSAEFNKWKDRKRVRYFDAGAQYRIEYTDRTWASDIAGLLKSHFTKLVDKPTSLKSLFFNNLDEITETLGVIVLVVTFASWGLFTAENTPVFSNQETLIAYLAKSFALMVVLWGLIKSLNIYFKTHVYVERTSSIILVDRDRKSFEKRKKKMGNRLMIYFGSWIMSIIAGLVSSHIYTKFLLGV